MGGLLALLGLPGTSLVSLQRLLADGQFRRSVADRLADPAIRTFWQHEFTGWKPQYQAEAIAPIPQEKKLGQFLSQPTLRAIVGQNRSRHRPAPHHGRRPRADRQPQQGQAVEAGTTNHGNGRHRNAPAVSPSPYRAQKRLF